MLARDLRVMDQAAFILARDYELPMHVFNFDQPGSMKAICQGIHCGTYISSRSVLELE
ncbi:Uridylate kinase [compost metagenome]